MKKITPGQGPAEPAGVKTAAGQAPSGVAMVIFCCGMGGSVGQDGRQGFSRIFGPGNRRERPLEGI
jgi:hypothetical protein